MATQGNNDNVTKLQVILHQQRQRLYPTLYNANSNVPQILNHFAVDYFLQDTLPDMKQQDDDRERIERAVEPTSKKLKHDHHHQPEAEIDVEETEMIPSEKKPTIVAITDCSNTNVPDIVSNQPDNEITAVPLDIISSSRIVRNNDTTDVPEKQTQPVVTPSSSSSRDIWGRIPPKEYIPVTTTAAAAATSNNNHTTTNSSSSMGSSSEAVSTCMMICSICQQKVGSSLRYASHLDKCLGIGTMSRNTNSGTSSILHNSNNTSSYFHS